MALTTVVRGRAYDWSYAIGRGAATGTGFNYVQTMCLSGDGDLYTANRGNENNFGMRVNRIKLGGPGDEELAAEFFQHGQGDGKATWPFGVPSGQNNEVFCSDEWTNTISVFDKDGKFKRKWGTTGSGDGELCAQRASRSRRTATSSWWTAATTGCRCSHRTASWSPRAARAARAMASSTSPGASRSTRTATSTSPDWKNHRVQKLSPQGKFLMKIGSYGALPAAGDSFAVTYLGPFVSSLPESHYPKAGLLNHPTDVAVDPDGDIYVTDWGNHRVRIFEADGTPLTNLYGDAQVFSKWARQSVDANPDMMKAYRRVRNSEPLYRFCFPTAVDFNPATDEIIVADSQRNRLQVYKKVRDYQDFQANL